MGYTVIGEMGGDSDRDVETFYEWRKVLPDMYYSDNYNNHRRAHVVVIGCCMRRYAPFRGLDGEVQETHIRKVERSCFNETCAVADRRNVSKNWQNCLFVHIYNMVTYRVQTNLSWSAGDEGSDYLIARVVAGDIDVEALGGAASRELRPARTKAMYDEIEERKNQIVAKRYSTQHECSKCGKRKTTEVEVQLRSLDEGSTLIITCGFDNCNNVWRIRS